MDSATMKRAIHAALAANWEDAISANLQLIKEDVNDIDALMRLSHAYLASGDSKKAQKYAKLASKLDPTNLMAQKCLAKCRAEVPVFPKKNGVISPTSFLEEPGRSKIVVLKHLGSPKTIARLTPGEELALNISKRQVSILTQEKQHVGRLPDEVAIWTIMHKKNDKVAAYVKNAISNEVKILLKLTSAT